MELAHTAALVHLKDNKGLYFRNMRFTHQLEEDCVNGPVKSTVARKNSRCTYRYTRINLINLKYANTKGLHIK